MTMATSPHTTAQNVTGGDDNLLRDRFSYISGAQAQVDEGLRDVAVHHVYPGLPGSMSSTYAITGGADAALFALDRTNGYLVFIDAPDYESPRDQGAGVGNNTYEVEITQRTLTTIGSQMLTVRVLDVDERPGTVPQTSFGSYRYVEVRYVVDADGAQRQLLRIGNEFNSVENGRDPVPMAVDGNGKTLLSAAVDGMTGGLTASGSAAPKAAGALLADMLREIGAHSDAGSGSRAALVEGGTRFLAGVAADAPVVLQTIVPVAAFGQGYGSMLKLAGTPADDANPLTALIVDTRGLANVNIEADDISFLALAGGVTLNAPYGTGAGAQQVWADDAAQMLYAGGGNDIVHAGGGADTISGGAGDDHLFGDAGNDLFFGGPGDDWIDGGADLDTVRLEGKRSDYIIRVEEGHFVVSARRTENAVSELGNITPPEGSDRIANVEVLHFQKADWDASDRGNVLRMIEALEDRVPTRIELDGWQAALASGMSLRDVATTLLAQYSGDDALLDYDFIQTLHMNAVGHRAHAMDMNLWLRSLNDATRADILVSFGKLGPVSLYGDIAGPATHVADSEIGSLVRMYDALFDRAPDAGGLNYWIGTFENGNTIATIADAFVTMAEGGINAMTDAEFIAHLYQSGLERTASPGEIAGWIKLMDEGALNRGDLLLGIADSAEMTALVGMMSTTIDLA
jgi:Ca2+-binding RTX toxin-like protein